MQHTDITCSVLVSGFMGWIELQKYFFFGTFEIFGLM